MNGLYESDYPLQPHNFYPTPAYVTRAIATILVVKGLLLWEPACGKGDMAEVLKELGAQVVATDYVDHGYTGMAAVFDFIQSEHSRDQLFVFDGILTNPPFGEKGELAELFIERGLELIGENQFLALLLPTNFDAASGRRDLFAENDRFRGRITFNFRIKWFHNPDKPKAGPKGNHGLFLWGSPPIREGRMQRVWYVERGEA